MTQAKLTRLVLASHNPGKVREIADLLAPCGVEEVLSATKLGLPEPAETESTFAGNARLKAEAACAATGLPALADDSGLEVAGLDGAPGVQSARWAGRERDFSLAMRRVMAALGEHGDRNARFVCVLALKQPGRAAQVFEGEIAGRIVWPPRGDRGFGYDPIFQPFGFDETFGEMAPEIKHAISHRAQAFGKLVGALESAP